MTTARDIALAIGVPVLVIVVLAFLVSGAGMVIFRKLVEGFDRIVERRRERVAARLEAAGADAVLQLDLDAWEAEMLTNLPSALPPSWAEAAEPRETTMAARESWPEPLSPRLTDYATGPLAAQPLPPRAEVAVWRPDPHWATIAPNYGRDTSEWRWERDSGAPVVDEQTHAAEVLQGLSRPRTQNTAALAMSQAFGHVVDAMPVSPAPQGRTRRAKGHNPGTDAQRLDPAFVSWEQADWEQPTGAFPMLTMAGAR